MIVDCHTHWGICWEDRDHGDPAKWLAVLDRHGVDQAWLMAHAGLVRPEFSRADNDLMAALAARAPKRLVPIGSAWPQQGREGVTEARRCLVDLRMPALKFHPWVQGFSTADPVFGEICGLAGELHAPVIFHDGTPCYSLCEQINGLARRFPATTFVLGHAGILWHWRSALEAARRPNVWICLCGPHQRAIEMFCQRFDPDRIIWGTDFGFGFTDPIAYRLGLIRRAKIKDDLREKILDANPRRLLAH